MRSEDGLEAELFAVKRYQEINHTSLYPWSVICIARIFCCW